MGIQNLLPFVKKACREANLSEFKHATVAVDALCWLHRGSIACAQQLALGLQPIYVQYVIRYVKLLGSFGLHVILVFDGASLPAKKMTDTARKEKRQSMKEKGKRCLEEGDSGAAMDCFKQTVSITTEMVQAVIQACREFPFVDVLVAPYESDAQLAYLALSNIAQLVITEDSDLIPFGCEKIFFKLDNVGKGMLYDRNDLPACVNLNPSKFSFAKFRRACIASGCDYLPSLPGIGLVKAMKFFTKTTNPDLKRILPKMPMYLQMSSLKVPEDYVTSFIRAEQTFLYQLAFDPFQKCQRPVNEYPEELAAADFPWCGERISDSVALQVSLGNIGARTHEQLASYNPLKDPKLKSIWNGAASFQEACQAKQDGQAKAKKQSASAFTSLRTTKVTTVSSISNCSEKVEFEATPGPQRQRSPVRLEEHVSLAQATRRRSSMTYDVCKMSIERELSMLNETGDGDDVLADVLGVGRQQNSEDPCSSRTPIRTGSVNVTSPFFATSKTSSLVEHTSITTCTDDDINTPAFISPTKQQQRANPFAVKHAGKIASSKTEFSSTTFRSSPQKQRRTLDAVGEPDGSNEEADAEEIDEETDSNERWQPGFHHHSRSPVKRPAPQSGDISESATSPNLVPLINRSPSLKTLDETAPPQLLPTRSSRKLLQPASPKFYPTKRSATNKNSISPLPKRRKAVVNNQSGEGGIRSSLAAFLYKEPATVSSVEKQPTSPQPVTEEPCAEERPKSPLTTIKPTGSSNCGAGKRKVYVRDDEIEIGDGKATPSIEDRVDEKDAQNGDTELPNDPVTTELLAPCVDTSPTRNKGSADLVNENDIDTDERGECDANNREADSTQDEAGAITATELQAIPNNDIPSPLEPSIPTFESVVEKTLSQRGGSTRSRSINVYSHNQAPSISSTVGDAPTHDKNRSPTSSTAQDTPSLTHEDSTDSTSSQKENGGGGGGRPAAVLLPPGSQSSKNAEMNVVDLTDDADDCVPQKNTTMKPGCRIAGLSKKAVPTGSKKQSRRSSASKNAAAAAEQPRISEMFKAFVYKK